MSLLEKYLEKNNEPKWQSFMSDADENVYLFEFTKNFPNLWLLEDGFRTYSKICAMTPEEFKKYVEESPAQAKSFMENLKRTKLFMTREGKKVPTAKGEVFEKFLQEKLTPEDRWFMDYLFAADAYFALESNYIFAETDRVFSAWQAAGYSLAQIYNSLIYLFNIRQGNMEEYLQTEYVIMITFKNDPEFLSAYRTASEFEKSELHDYISDNFTKERYACIVSSKFSPTALIDCDTVLDDAKLLFFTHYIKNSHPISLENMVDVFAQVYTRFYKLNVKKVTNFIMMYEDVFRMTYLNLFSNSRELPLSEAECSFEQDEDALEEAIKDNFDYTTTETLDTLNKVNAVFSSAAKYETDFKCELHKENRCKYFTSKETGKPYLEIHQLIPRDYANEFGSSIERASNYVPLCPHCHRLIHQAADAERFRLLATIYQKRKSWLAEDGIEPSNELLFAIYGIEQSKLNPGENDFAKPFLDAPQPKLGVGKRGLRLKEKTDKLGEAEPTGETILVGAAEEPARKKPSARSVLGKKTAAVKSKKK